RLHTADAGRHMVKACTYDRLLGTLLLLTILVASALAPMQNDTWWHLRAGQDIWSAHRVALSDSYSHTAYGSFWRTTNGWLRRSCTACTVSADSHCWLCQRRSS